MSKTESIDWQRSRRLSIFLVAIFACIVFLFFLYKSLLVSLLFGLFFAYLLSGLTDLLEKKLKLSRTVVVLGIILFFISFFAIIVASLVPIIYQEGIAIVKLLPEAMDYILNKIDPLKEVLAKSGFVKVETINSAFAEFNVVLQVGDQAKAAFQQLWSTTPKLLGGALNLFLVPVILFFLLRDLPKIRKGLRKLIPSDLISPIYYFQSRIDWTLKSVLKGQVMVAATLSILYMIGLSIVGLEFGIAIGAISGVCRIIPYLDVVVGLTMSLVVIVTKTSGFTQLIGVFIVFIVVQSIDGMYITPRIIGQKAGLHPGVVIGSIIAFADWFGFWGVLIAAPVVAIVMVVIEMLIPYYLASPLYFDRRVGLVANTGESSEES